MTSIQYSTYRTTGSTSTTNGATGSSRVRTESPALRTRYTNANLVNNAPVATANNQFRTNTTTSANLTGNTICKKQLLENKISAQNQQANLSGCDFYSYNNRINSDNNNYDLKTTVRRSSIKSNTLTSPILPTQTTSSLNTNRLNQQSSSKIKEILGTTSNNSNLNKSNKYKTTLSKLNMEYNNVNTIDNSMNNLNLNDNQDSNYNYSSNTKYSYNSSNSDLNGPTQFFPAAASYSKSSNLLPSPSSTSSSSSSSSPPINYQNHHHQNNYNNHQKHDSMDDLDSKGIVGLKNLGNTCFMNSILQCLSNTKCLLEYCLRGAYVNDLNTTLSVMKGSLFRSYAALIKTMWSKNPDDIFSPSDFKSQIARFAPRFVGYAQQDAEEFLYYLLKGLHEDVNLIKKKPTPIKFDEKAWDRMNDIEKSKEHWEMNLRYENSRISDMFVGQLKSTLQCTKCNYRSPTFELFWHLALPIPNKSTSIKLDDCLKLFMAEEILDGDNKPQCSTCKEKRRCTKRYTIEKLPKILVIHLKRFSKTRFNSKINLNIDYPIDGLDMSKYLSSFVESTSSSSPSSSNSRPHSSSYLYDLYGISLHSGTESSGHYVAYAKHPFNKSWNCFNDSMVRSISQSSLHDSNAYILFYQLRGS